MADSDLRALAHEFPDMVMTRVLVTSQRTPTGSGSGAYPSALIDGTDPLRAGRAGGSAPSRLLDAREARPADAGTTPFRALTDDSTLGNAANAVITDDVDDTAPDRGQG